MAYVALVIAIIALGLGGYSCYKVQGVDANGRELTAYLQDSTSHEAFRGWVKHKNEEVHKIVEWIEKEAQEDDDNPWEDHPDNHAPPPPPPDWE